MDSNNNMTNQFIVFFDTYSTKLSGSCWTATGTIFPRVAQICLDHTEPALFSQLPVYIYASLTYEQFHDCAHPQLHSRMYLRRNVKLNVFPNSTAQLCGQAPVLFLDPRSHWRIYLDNGAQRNGRPSAHKLQWRIWTANWCCVVHLAVGHAITILAIVFWQETTKFARLRNFEVNSTMQKWSEVPFFIVIPHCECLWGSLFARIALECVLFQQVPCVFEHWFKNSTTDQQNPLWRKDYVGSRAFC